MLTTCLSLANKTAMLYGKVTFANVMKLFDCADNFRKVPHGMSVAQFAAMIVQSTKGGMVCRAGKFCNVWVD